MSENRARVLVVDDDPLSRKILEQVLVSAGFEVESAADEIGLRYLIEAKLQDLLNQETTPLSAEDKREIIGDVIDNILGYGPIEALLNDPTVTEVMVNSPRTVYIERAGKIYLTDRHFVDEAHLLRIIDKIVARVGRRVDEASPRRLLREADGHLQNGLVAGQLYTLLAENGRWKEAVSSLERLVELSPLMEKPLKEWVTAQRARTGYHLGKRAESARLAAELEDEFHQSFAKALARAPEVPEH